MVGSVLVAVALPCRASIIGHSHTSLSFLVFAFSILIQTQTPAQAGCCWMLLLVLSVYVCHYHDARRMMDGDAGGWW
jgi:hypothetical protein